MRIRRFFGVLVLSLIANTAVAQGLPPDLPNRERIQSYVAAFNAGDDAMSAFLKGNVSEAALQRRSLADRLQIYKQMHARMKSLEIKGVPDVRISGNEMAIKVRMKTDAGPVDITFNFEPATPHKLIALQVEDADGPDGRPSPQAGPPMSESEFVKKVSDTLDDATKKDEFSGAVLLARKGKVIFEKAYGYADRDKKIPNDVNTKFNLGSINKIFTRICIDQLVSQGKLTYTDKLGKYLPDYPNADAREKVTIAQLLTMRSGIGDFFGPKYQQTPKSKLRSLADYLPLFADQPLLFEPGTKNQYSNGGYVVLGLIIEKVSGQDYYSYVKKNVFDVAGMKDTDSYLSDQKVTDRAEGYTTEQSEPGQKRNNEFSRPWRGSSAGGGYSTVRDMLRFTEALSSGKLVMLSPETGKPALGGMGIAGGAPGINSALEFDLQSGNVVIVMTNIDPPAASARATEFSKWLRSVQS